MLTGEAKQEGGEVFSISGKNVWVAGHRGMVGSALVRRLQSEECNVLTVDRKDIDLSRQSEVEDWLMATKPEVVIISAAKVGGILANDTYSADFIYDNLMIAANIIHAAHQICVEKLLFLGSSCIYPKLTQQPIPEKALLDGSLEPTNQWYATAKIAGTMLCKAYRRQHGHNFITAMPTNLYGPGDNFDLITSHVVPALLAKAHAAKTGNFQYLDVWGTGRPRREFLHVDDLADALVYLLKYYSEDEHINVGCGSDVTISDLVQTVCEIVGFNGELRFLTDKPDGTPRKLLDISRLQSLGWSHQISLREGLASTYKWYLENEYR